MQGYAGLEDEVDNHTWRVSRGIVLSTLLDVVEALRSSTQDNVNQAGQRITQRNLDILPTVKIRPG